jgi:hypothetical protein
METREGSFREFKFFQLAKRKRELQKVQRVLLGKMETSGATLQGNRIQGLSQILHVQVMEVPMGFSKIMYCSGSHLGYLTLRSVSSLYNAQNIEMKFCENMKLTC